MVCPGQPRAAAKGRPLLHAVYLMFWQMVCPGQPRAAEKGRPPLDAVYSVFWQMVCPGQPRAAEKGRPLFDVVSKTLLAEKAVQDNPEMQRVGLCALCNSLQAKWLPRTFQKGKG